MNARFHSFRGVDACQLPLLFNCPFSYVPHPLCVQASESVMRYLEQQENWAEELRRGRYKYSGHHLRQQKDCFAAGQGS